MTDDAIEILPYKSAGPYRLGMTREACAEAAGPPGRERNNLPMRWVHEHRGPVEAIFEKKKLAQVVFSDGARVRLRDVDVLGDPGALAALRALDPDAREQGQYVNLPKLGVCLGGFGRRRLPEGRQVIVYAKSQQKLMAILGSV